MTDSTEPVAKGASAALPSSEEPLMDDSTERKGKSGAHKQRTLYRGMKASAVYRKAAKIVSAEQIAACFAILKAGGNTTLWSDVAVRKFGDLFRPDHCVRLAWGWQWATDGAPPDDRARDATGCRVLALLLMSEIAKDEP